MGVGGSLAVIGAGTVWRSTGLRSAGQALVRATSSGDEQIRTLGGMMLVQAGERSVDLVMAALQDNELNPTLVRVLGDIGGTRSEGLLGEIAQGGGPMAVQAQEELETLKRIESLEEGDEEKGK